MHLRTFRHRRSDRQTTDTKSANHKSHPVSPAGDKNAKPPGGHIFQATGTMFENIQDIIGTYLLTMFHDYSTIIMAFRVLTRLPRPIGGHVFPPTGTIFKLIQDMIGTNRLTKFCDDRTINVTSRVLIKKNASLPGGHVFKTTKTIFKLIQYIIETNLLTKFHEHREINVASRVLTRKNAPPPGGHVFQPTGIIFFTHRSINVASREKNAPPLGNHVFQANITIFDLIQDIIATNHLSKFHEDWGKNVASRVLTRQMLTPHNARRTNGDHKSSVLR
ncbi:hypothetical protein DPMN_133513 [Dreissena polymorpha]|uniref:Uncharacterized protein n=1 Tax=Dreissena polymorpha TaxID=45954 RepID=A0A9D4FVP6_DREPO|nr:hypothetical protein DPMN_133513 [Dreissena polymorpha]